METDLRAALSMKQDDEMKSVSVASQLLVDALVTLVDTHRLAEASGQEETVHAEEGRGAEGAAMTLILKLVASGRTCVPSPVALKLLSLVLARSSSPASPIPAGQTPRAANMDRLMSGIEGSIPDLAWCSGSSQGEFEAIKLLRSFQYSSMAEEVNQGGAMEASLSWKESSVAAMMCSEAGMHRAACLVHHIRGDYASAVDSLLSLPPSSSCSRQHPASQYLSMHLSQDGASSFSSPLLSGSGTVRSSLTAAKRLREVVPRMIEALSTRMVDLLAMDPLPTLASKLILDHLPQSSHLSLALQGGQGSSHVTGKASHCSRDVRFAFLSAARVLAADERTSGESSTVAQDSPARDYPTWGPASPLMNNAEVAETFLSLLCQYTPHEALPYLISLFSSSTAAPDAIQADGRANVWDVQKLLACCRASKVPDAEAFLLEKLGEDEEACRLWLSHVKASFDLPSTLAHPQDKAELMDKLQLIVRAVSSAVEFCGRHLRSHKHLEPNTNIEAAYWLRLLDVILNKKHGDAENNLSGGDELEALMRVRSIMAEEVVERVSALIPPASVARSLALHYASGKFGELKRPMTRIFEACAHEQRLVGSTHRLIGGDAFATFLQLKATRTKSSSGAQGPKGSGHGMQLPCQSEVANGVLQRPFKNPQGFHLLDKTLQESRKPDGIRATILIDHRGTSASLDNNGPVGNTPEGREQEEEQGLFDVDEILAWAKAV